MVRPMVVIATPEMMQPIYGNPKNISKGDVYDGFTPILGNSLSLATDDQWKKSRRLLNPAFHIQVLNSYMYAINETSVTCSRELEEAIEENGGGEFDILPIMTRCVLDLLCETAMGRKTLTIEDNENLIRNCEGYQKIFQQRLIQPWLRINWLFKLTERGRVFKNLSKGIKGFSQMLVKHRRALLERKSSDKKLETNDNVDDEPLKKKLGFMDLIIKECDVNGNYSEDEMINEVTSMVTGGHDTTALAFTWFLYTIARHPEHQQLIVDELNAVFDDADRPCTTQDLTELKYLECCIKESLRLYPSIPFILRYLPEDLEIGDYTLPKGLTIGLSIFAMHHNPQVFPDPETFKPQRFLPENSVGRHPFAFSPFSAGPRNCIGQKFAMLELKVILANLIRQFHFFVDPSAPEVIPLQETTLNPKTPVNLIVSKRLSAY
ncbi:cytochrome P450 4c3-like isoform X2 [Daphnia pulicaria]|nr:cytochrome P450 4c3-like isoform X2 [Daphnia pulicaria]